VTWGSVRAPKISTALRGDEFDFEAVGVAEVGGVVVRAPGVGLFSGRSSSVQPCAGAAVVRASALARLCAWKERWFIRGRSRSWSLAVRAGDCSITR
jgi:hypothetical protein